MSIPEKMSLEDYVSIVRMHMPDFHRVACAETEEEFCDAVGTAVRRCLSKLEDRRTQLSQAGEVELSTDLADLLTAGGIPTTAETYVNGHVDLIVSHFEAGRYRMLGECKLDRGPGHHCKGTTQVLGYCSGAERRALSISFCHKTGIDKRMRVTRQHFGTRSDCHDVVGTTDYALPWTFLGVHRHSSGKDVEVLHIGCNLHEAAMGKPKKKVRPSDA